MGDGDGPGRGEGGPRVETALLGESTLPREGVELRVTILY